MKDVWILEDDERYMNMLKAAVRDAGFDVKPFSARNPFLRAYTQLNDRSGIHAMILDNQVPFFDEGDHPRPNVGVGLIKDLGMRDMLDVSRIALYTSNDINSRRDGPRIREVCELGVQYFQKDFSSAPYWVESFLKD